MISAMIVVLDEGRDLGPKVSLEEVVFEQNAVLECLVPAFDLALHLRVTGSTVNVGDLVFLLPFAEIGDDVTRASVRQQAQPVFDLDRQTLRRIECALSNGLHGRAGAVRWAAAFRQLDA